MPKTTPLLTRQQITRLFTILQAENPLPQTELEYQTPFQLLAAVILSAQATDVSVNKCTPALFTQAPDASSMAKLGEDGIKPLIQTIGLFNSKAKNLAKTAKILHEQYHGEVPTTREELQALPGVGRKTANVVLNTAFEQNTIAVDTHVFRVANRTGLAPGKNVDNVESSLMKRVPKEFLRHAHHWLILLGRYTCLARSPKCDQCLVYKQCNFPAKSR